MTEANPHTQKLLLFHLNDERLFGLGTLKIREIIPFSPLTKLPKSHPTVVGSISYRGSALPVIDTASAVGYAPMTEDEMKSSSIIVTDVQRREIGFLVKSVASIIEGDWKQVLPPPKSLGESAFITGLIKTEEQIVQLMDLELLLSRIYPESSDVELDILTEDEQQSLRELNILLVDDSQVARKQLSDALDNANVPYTVTSSGQDAQKLLIEADDKGHPIDILVSDIEMPGLDGYELTFNVRDNREMKQPYVILHTSLNSKMSVSYAKQVGADEALTKFDAEELLQAILRGGASTKSGAGLSG